MLVRQTVAINGIHGVALMKLDILDGLTTLKICTGYKVGERVLDSPPRQHGRSGRRRPRLRGDGRLDRDHLRRPILEATCRPTAVKYVRRIEELIGAPVAVLSTSPDREDTILMRDPVRRAKISVAVARRSHGSQPPASSVMAPVDADAGGKTQ